MTDKPQLQVKGLSIKRSLMRLQFEAAWALTNVASGTTEHVQFLVENDIISNFLNLLDSKSEDVIEQVSIIYKIHRIDLGNLGPWEHCWGFSSLQGYDIGSRRYKKFHKFNTSNI